MRKSIEIFHPASGLFPNLTFYNLKSIIEIGSLNFHDLRFPETNLKFKLIKSTNPPKYIIGHTTYLYMQL